MALNPDTLTNAIAKAFNDSKEHGWSTEEVAAALAGAIDTYVRDAAVQGVTVDIATGQQTGNGSLA